jgi:uncharacterized protein involved in exopolysaccharide biosynthesis
MADLKNDLSWLFSAKFWKWLLIGAAGTFFLVYLLTAPWFVTPMYRSEAVIYVPLTLFSQQYEQQGIGFGTDHEIDGHIQIMLSSRLLDSLEARFDLSGRLEVDLNAPGGHSRLHQMIRSRLKIEKTRYHSVSVRVSDPDPQAAADIANAIVELGDVIKEDILKENRLAAVRFARERYEQKKEEVDALESQLFPDGRITPVQQFTRQVEPFRQMTLYEAELWELSKLRNRFQTLQKSLDVSLPGAYVVSPAQESHRHAWPPRILLSLGAVAVFIVIMAFVEILKKDGT